ncbi:MAG TPA: hypothetical protein VLD36_12030 [Burkholderiales bacterium]|nr:hypothetical protein [Burkholderiales bacterium]
MKTKTKTMITAAAAATLLLAAPLAAFADGGRHGWGNSRYSHDRGHGWKHGHYKPGYAYGPARVQPYYYPAPRVVVPPVYVPVPAPVVAVPVPAPYPYPYPHRPANSVDIGFRLFF